MLRNETVLELEPTLNLLLKQTDGAGNHLFVRARADKQAIHSRALANVRGCAMPVAELQVEFGEAGSACIKYVFNGTYYQSSGRWSDALQAAWDHVLHSWIQEQPIKSLRAMVRRLRPVR